MNPVLSFRQPSWRFLTVLVPAVFSFLLVLQTPSAWAQQPAVSAGGSGLGTTPLLTLDAYNALRTPSISLTLGKLVKGSLAAKLAKLNALADGSDTPAVPGLIQPQSRNGVFDEVSLGYLDGSGKPPAPVNVTLQFIAARAGATVWIQPLDGGAILGQDADGNPISSPGGCAGVLDASGQLVFGYQALALPGRYQVLVRLDNVSTILPFIIQDPSQDNQSHSPAEDLPLFRHDLPALAR